MRAKKEKLLLVKRKRRGLRKTIKLFFYPLILVGFISLLYWGLFYSRFFSIKEIKILTEGPNILTKEEIFDLIKKQNRKFTLPYLKESLSFVFLSEKEMESELKKNHPEIDSLKIRLSIPKNLLEINYQKRIEAFNLKTEKGYFLMDRKGIPFLKIDEPKKDLPIIDLKEDISLGEIAIKEENLKTLEKCFNLINEKNNLIKFDRFVLEKKDSSDFQIITNNAMKIFINFKDNLEEIFLILEKLKEQQFQGQFKNIEYIDLRYLPKVYYK